MEVAHPDAQFVQVVRQAFRHFLGQGGHQHPFFFFDHLVDFAHQIVHLPGSGAHDDLGVKQARGPDDLLHDLAGPFPLVGRGGGGYVNHLLDAGVKLLISQGPVVKGGGQAETVIHQHVLPGPVPRVHGANLRHGHVAFVDHHQKALGEIIQQTEGRVALLAPVKIPAVILDAGAEADLPQHFDIVFRALGDALGFQQLAFRLKLRHSLLHVAFDAGDVFFPVLLVGGVVGGGKDRRVLHGMQHVPVHHGKLADPVDLVAEKFHADAVFQLSFGDHLHSVPPNAEIPPFKRYVVALILNVHQTAQQLFRRHFHPRTQGNHLPLILAGVAHGINAGNGGDNNHVVPLLQGGGGAVAQTVDFQIDGSVLFDVGIGRRNIGFRLVIIVIGNEIFHRAVREKGLELAAQLGGQRFVVGDHQGGPLHLFDDGRHGKGFARTRHPQQHLGGHALLHPSRQGFDGLGLIPPGGIGRFQNKLTHRVPPNHS